MCCYQQACYVVAFTVLSQSHILKANEMEMGVAHTSNSVGRTLTVNFSFE